MKQAFFLLKLSVVVLGLNACKKHDHEVESKVFTASGNIDVTLEEFRQSLGPLNTSTGAVTGRREITWEIVPDDMLEKTLPEQFFNQTGPGANAALQRGLAYSPGSNFQVSRTQFAGINSEASSQFAAFSGTSTFANVSTNQWPVFFQVAGTLTPAAVKGFGVVVSDVDKANSVKIEFLNGDKVLRTVAVPPHDGESNFSFAGVLFKEAVVTNVRVSHQGILSQNTKDVSQGGADDLVIMDDFIYGEPIKK